LGRRGFARGDIRVDAQFTYFSRDQVTILSSSV
jgi:hypothetical protein